ncbi:MAG: NAD-dependent epimerase/dehydratase family protein [Chloroflexi bacterium]|jgi:NAD dependent epimerase/dehydratase|nr:GDP-mannose 4,6-dehydratase [Anaerolineaceae bacterium]NMB87612.1 NAD-dependent epimerase/dehydratase family protein [Chloroflexota bacterium]
MEKNCWSNKRVLVTGAGGFIGSHLVEQLVIRGAHVRAFVRYNSRGDPGLLRMVSPQVRSQIEILSGDIRDAGAVRQAVDGCAYVYHLAALISIPYSYLHPIEVADTNFTGTLNVLMASREARVERVVHTSTSEVYGTAQYIPIDESHPLQGQSPYSASKIGADKLAESFYSAYGLPVVTIRPFNTYGPRQSARAVIPTIITQALASQTICLGNLETTRDFTYVDDTVNGFLRGVEADDVEGKTFNLGTGEEIQIGQLARLIIDKVGNPVEIEIDEQRLRPRDSEVFRLHSDNRSARDHLGWAPQYCLDQGLDRTIAWISEHLGLFRVGSYQF